jgi:hypothetical protein
MKYWRKKKVEKPFLSKKKKFTSGSRGVWWGISLRKTWRDKGARR